MQDADVIVVGAGHAGVEAALAVSRMGHSCLLLTLDKAKLAVMSCNPAVGGPGKSHVVKEIDAMGGLMGQAADATGIQFRRLNLSKGPAVWATRVQVDRDKYCRFVTEYVRCQERIDIVQGAASQIVVRDGRAVGVITEAGQTFSAQAVILATGTFLNGLMHIGDKKISGGRSGEPASWQLSKSLEELGFGTGRLKTGTPPRLDGRTIDWDKCRVQPGDQPAPYFSIKAGRRPVEQTPCYLTQTTLATKTVITANMALSPMFSGQIDSAGPRYCPSIEAKYHRFKDKETHLMFLESEGRGTQEVYPNGFSTGLPETIQLEAIRTVTGLEKVKITQPGYAIEYDYYPAHQITPSLQTKLVKGLYFAGQINGTSGYEEAAGQGLMAGVNSVLAIRREPPLVLDRSQAYIGVMIDDLATRSTTEPYRLFTSRAEYRLILREDNARDRLAGIAHRLGLISPPAYRDFEKDQEQTRLLITRLGKKRIAVSQLGGLGARFKKRDNISLRDLLKQPRVTVADVLPLLRTHFSELAEDVSVLNRAAIAIYYEGYIERQDREIERFRNLERCKIPLDFDHSQVPSLKNEAREKLIRFKPLSLGQASRIEGVTPGDISVLSVFLLRHKGERMSASAHLTRSLDPESLLKGLDPEKRLNRYFELLAEENQKVNLVSRETIQSGLPKLAAESLLPFESMHPLRVVNYLDIGSGGGFPSFPILLTQGIQNTTLVERTQKKAAALRRMLQGLSIDANIIERSFEELTLAANFDLITIRLVKLTPQIYTKVLAALKPGGTLVYYAEWDKSLSTEGLRRSSISYQTPPTDIIKHITIVNK